MPRKQVSKDQTEQVEKQDDVPVEKQEVPVEQSKQEQPKQEHHERKFNRRPVNSITNFKFSEVLSCTSPVNATDTTVLLQYLVAKAKMNGQFELYKVLNATLAASNHECEMPQLVRKPFYRRGASMPQA